MDSGAGQTHGARADINVTPLIDIVLVLLIIFLVLTPSLLKHMTAQVPRNTAAEAAPVEMPTVVEYHADRGIFINHEAVTWEGLAVKVAERLRDNKRKLVFFKPEDDCAYGDVVKLMDIVRGAGATSLGIVTREP